MSVRQLILFSSPVSDPPSFVIPVFSIPGSNQSCVQDLDGTGKISRFCSFDSNRFFTVPILLPSFHVNVGDEGLLAFWVDAHTVFVGVSHELKPLLSALDEHDLPAFVAVEALSLVGDPTRIGQAAKRAAAKFASASARTSYQNRVSNRAAVLAALASNKRTAEALGDWELEQVLEVLQSALAEKNWYAAWRVAWQRYGGEEKLFAVARWRLENFESTQIDNDVALDVLMRKFNEDIGEFSFELLKRRGEDWQLWYGVWTALWINHYRTHDLIGLGLSFLYADIHVRRTVPYQWMIVWRKLWQANTALKADLEQLANAARDAAPHDDYFAEHVVIPLVDQHNAAWAKEYLQLWLGKPRPINIWVDTYIRFLKSNRSAEYIASGVAWLRKYGKGMNAWMKLWEHLRRFMREDAARDVAEEWLVKARKDLKSWPQVFREVVRPSDPSSRLVHAAQLWIEATEGAKRDALIEQIGSK